MIYTASITTSNGTDYSNRVRTPIQVTKGLIYRVEIEFPPGCAGLQHVQIFDGNYQMYPSTPGESFHTDASIIGFDDLYIKKAAPFIFNVITWNNDDTWEHTIQVRIGMVSNEAFQSRYMPSISWEKFSQVMEDAYKAQLIEQQTALASLGETVGGM